MKDRTYARTQCIFLLHPVTSGAAGTGTACKSSRQMVGHPESEGEKRTPQSDSGQGYPTDTICSLLSVQSMHGRH